MTEHTLIHEALRSFGYLRPHLRRCPKPACGHWEPLPEESEDEAVETTSTTSQSDDS